MKRSQPEQPQEPEEPELSEEDEDDEDYHDILGSYLTTEDGHNVATALLSITKAIENQNKILIKILSKLS